MFHLTVRDHVMIAHSLPHPSFGPAQNLHGATYVVELTLWRETLSPESIVIDIGEAADVFRNALSDLNYRNLDEHPEHKVFRLQEADLQASPLPSAQDDNFEEMISTRRTGRQ